MTTLKPASLLDWDFPRPNFTNYIQTPLPDCLDTLPKLYTIQGQGTEGQDSAPLPAPKEPANA